MIFLHHPLRLIMRRKAPKNSLVVILLKSFFVVQNFKFILLTNSKCTIRLWVQVKMQIYDFFMRPVSSFLRYIGPVKSSPTSVNATQSENLSSTIYTFHCFSPKLCLIIDDWRLLSIDNRRYISDYIYKCYIQKHTNIDDRR